MYPVSDRFLARLAESHAPVTRVQLFLTNGRVVDIAHTGGSVTVDRSQAIRPSRRPVSMASSSSWAIVIRYGGVDSTKTKTNAGSSSRPSARTASQYQGAWIT